MCLQFISYQVLQTTSILTCVTFSQPMTQQMCLRHSHCTYYNTPSGMAKMNRPSFSTVFIYRKFLLEVSVQGHMATAPSTKAPL